MKKLCKKCIGILCDGKYDNFSVNTNLMNIDSLLIEMNKRAGYAYMLATHPETFDLLTQNNINLFHGTNSNALPSILKNGLKSLKQASNSDISITTGEASSVKGPERNFVSFTDNIDTALEYTTYPSKAPNKLSGFGVLIGISQDDVANLKTRTIHSDEPELGIVDEVPAEHIKFIAAPQDKVDLVKKLANEKTNVVAFENDPFYYIDNVSIYIDNEKFQNMLDGNKAQSTPKTFDDSQLQSVAKKGIKSRIIDAYKKFSDKFKDKDVVRRKDYDTREQ